MSKWIDAEWLKAEFPHDEDWDYPVNTNSYVVEMIDEAPSIDIVRCAECVYADKYYHCNYMTTWNNPDDFCSYGEREGE